MPDPDTMRQLSDAANGAASSGGGSQGVGAALGAAIGAAGVYMVRAFRGDATAEAVRDEARKTREVLESVGTTTHAKLDELTRAVAHLQGRVEGMDRR